jgi:cytochrome d ubiquinol oxidase subunit I
MILANGKFVLTNFSALFTNPWLWPSYLHNQAASLVTSSFVVAGGGALYILSKRNEDYGKMFLKTELFWLISSLIVAVPTGDLLAKNVVKYQPVTLLLWKNFHTEEKEPKLF